MLSSITFAQRWVDLGIKGGYGANILINNNIFSDNEYNHKLSGGFAIGGKLGYNMSNVHEITFDVMYTKFNQKFQYNLTDTSGASPQYLKTFSYNTLDFMLMYRANTEGRYFEIGPKYSLISNATDKDEFTNNVANDVSDYTVENSFGMVLGFGNYFFGTDNFGITFGARFSYDFTDMISPNGKTANYPTGKEYTSYKASTPFSAILVCEMNLDFGYLAKANCGKRTKLIIF